MTLRDRVDPELIGGLDFLISELGPAFMASPDAPKRRAEFVDFLAKVTPPEPPFPHIERTDRRIPGPEAAQDLGLRIYRRADAGRREAAILFIHGGGFTIGDIAQDDAPAAALAEVLGVTVISVEYRLAPEHPHPAPVEDCYCALRWLVANAVDLGVDPTRVAVYGHSAGGALAAAVALMARDRGGPALTFQMLCYPMLDDRNDTPSSRAMSGLGAWDRSFSDVAWTALLGRTAGAPVGEVSPYAAPARATDLARLPPTYIDVGELDVLLDEDMTYARRLMAAGVAVELHVYPAAYHGFDMFVPDAAVSQTAVSNRMSALKRALRLSSK